MLVGSLLTKEHSTGWLYTANAATVSKKRSVCEPVGMANCVLTETKKQENSHVYIQSEAFANLSAWRIAS